MLADKADYSTEAYAYDMGTDIILGDPALLHSRARRQLIDQRAIGIQLDEQAAARREAAKPVRFTDDGRVEMRTQLTQVVGAFKGMSTEGRAHVVLAFGDEIDTAELLAVTIPDARNLVTALRRALDAPMVTAR